MLLNVLVQENIKLQCKSEALWEKPKDSNLRAVMLKFGAYGDNPYALVPKLFKQGLNNF